MGSRLRRKRPSYWTNILGGNDGQDGFPPSRERQMEVQGRMDSRLRGNDELACGNDGWEYSVRYYLLTN